MTKTVEESSNWYLNQQLDFDKALIEFRYRAIKDFFVGENCLELGTGNGVMTAMLKDRFKVLDIVDGSQQLLDIIPKYENVRKFCSWFENFNPPQKYNTIVMEHILEHIKEPIHVLKRILNWIEPDGRIIIGVPNAKSFHRLAAVKMGLLPTEYTLNQRDHDVGHFRVYDLESLSGHAEEAGFTIVNKGGVFFKPVSNQQINDTWTSQMMEGFYELGKDFQYNAAEIYIVAKR